VNLLGGLDLPTSGKILIDGEDLSKLKSSQLIDFRLRISDSSSSPIILFLFLLQKKMWDSLWLFRKLTEKKGKKGPGPY
jgi:ABC-type oligopeptide transport system ATPase subunit